jgi:hypothetical protein
METNFTIDWIAVTAPYRKDYKYWDYAYPAGAMFLSEKPAHGYNMAVSNAYFTRIAWHTERKEMGVHCTYSGQCLNVHVNNGIAKDRIVKFHAARGDKFTRFDVALDVHDSNLNIRSLAAQLKRGTAKTRFQTWNLIDGSTGQTLYLGSRQSEQFMRIYDKGRETGDGSNWKRIELELKGSRAEMFAKETARRVEHETAQATRQAIKHLVSFNGPTWLSIVGNLAIGIAKAQEGQTDTVAWLLWSVAPARGKYLAKYGDNGITARVLTIVAAYAEQSAEPASE